MKIYSTVLLTALLATVSLTAFAADLAQGDKEFVMKAAQGGLIEVKLGELAGTKGKSEEVKAFGARMVKDHSMANAELKAVATSKGVTLSDDLDATHQKKVDAMSKMEGDKFDKAYVKDMVKDHVEDVSEFEKASTSLKDPDLKAFATKTLPTLKAHLEHIKGLEKKG